MIEIKGRNGLFSSLTILLDRVMTAFVRFVVIIFLIDKLRVKIFKVLYFLKLFLSLRNHFLVIFDEHWEWLNDFLMKLMLFILDFKVLDYVLRYLRAAVISDFLLKFWSKLLNLFLELLSLSLYIIILSVLIIKLRASDVQTHLIALLMGLIDSFLWYRSDTGLGRFDDGWCFLQDRLELMQDVQIYLLRLLHLIDLTG